MNRLEKLQVLQRLRDISQSVIVVGEMKVHSLPASVISVICDMKYQATYWKAVIDLEMKDLKGEDNEI